MKLLLGLSSLLTAALAQNTQPALARNIAIVDEGIADGTMIATSNAKGNNLVLKVSGLDSITIGLPTDIDSMDDISISDEGYLFGLSMYTPVFCSFRVVLASIEPIGCLDAADFSLNPYSGLSCKGGTCVISGGAGGYTVVTYNRVSGMLDTTLRCLNCYVGGVNTNGDSYVEVALLDSRYAAISTVRDASAVSIVVDLNTNEEAGIHEIPDPVDSGLGATPTNYPCVSDFYRSTGGQDYMFTACGSLTVQSVLTANSTTVITPPVQNFSAITLAVDKTRNVVVVGGRVMDSSVIIVYAIDPVTPTLITMEFSGGVEGTILSLAVSGGNLGYMTLESDDINTLNLSSRPSLAPSKAPDVSSGAPSSSSAPSVAPSVSTSSPVQARETTSGSGTASVIGALLMAVVTWMQL